MNSSVRAIIIAVTLAVTTYLGLTGLGYFGDPGANRDQLVRALLLVELLTVAAALPLAFIPEVQKTDSSGEEAKSISSITEEGPDSAQKSASSDSSQMATQWERFSRFLIELRNPLKKLMLSAAKRALGVPGAKVVLVGGPVGFAALAALDWHAALDWRLIPALALGLANVWLAGAIPRILAGLGNEAGGVEGVEV